MLDHHAGRGAQRDEDTRQIEVDGIAPVVELVEDAPGRAGAVDALAGAVEGLGEPLPAYRLQEVVDRPHLERRHRVAVVGGDEDDVGDVPNPLEDVEAGALGHLHVEQAQIGRGLVDQLDRRLGVGGLARELEVGMRLEQPLHPVAGRLLVVDDDAAVAHDALSAAPRTTGTPGRVRRAQAPVPFGAADSARAARPP